MAGSITTDAVTCTTATVGTLTVTTLSGGAFTAMPTIPSQTVAAAGTDATNGGALATGFNLVSAANGTKGVVLPVAAAGKVVIVKNNAAGALKIWPATGDAVNAEIVDAVFSITNLTSVLLVAYDATTWYSVPLVAS